MTAFETSLGIRVGDDAEHLVIHLEGDLDASSVSELVTAVTDRRPWSTLVLDVAELNFVDSAGLRGLLSIRQMAREDGAAELQLAHVNTRLQRLLDLSGLADAFQLAG